MDKIQKYAAIFGVIGMGIVGLMLLGKAARPRHHSGMYEKVGRGIDERLRESKEALDKATGHFQSAFEHIKNQKP